MIQLDQLTTASAIVAIQMSSNASTWTNPVIISHDGMLQATWQDLYLSIPVKPNKVLELRKNVKYIPS